MCYSTMMGEEVCRIWG